MLALLFKPLTLACLLSAASFQSLPPKILVGLLRTEGGHVGSWTTDANGSHDLGPMQVNDATWVKEIAGMQFGGDEAKAEAAIIYNGCYNVNVGAWIFRQYLDEAGGNYYVAIGYYNSHNPVAASAYRQRFLQTWERLGFARRARD